MTDDERRQKLIVAQSSVKSAIDYTAGHEYSLDMVLQVADKIFDWVMNKGNNSGVTNNSVSNTVAASIPTPTLKQREWLDKIEAKHGYTHEQIKKVYGKYPSTKEEALDCIKMMKK